MAGCCKFHCQRCRQAGLANTPLAANHHILPGCPSRHLLEGSQLWFHCWCGGCGLQLVGEMLGVHDGTEERVSTKIKLEVLAYGSREDKYQKLPGI